MRRSNLFKRAAASRDPKTHFSILTEGKNTEPEYFDGLRNKFKETLIDIEIIGAAGVPFTLVEKAEKIFKSKKKKKNSLFEEKDQIWIVFDRDEHPKIPETFEKCRNNNIGVAFSNPCFELWIILHFEDFDKVLDRHKIQEYLGSICEFYKKHKGKRINFSELINNIDAAEDRAKSQKKKREAEAPPLNPPYTTVYDLTEAIRKASQKHKKK